MSKSHPKTVSSRDDRNLNMGESMASKIALKIEERSPRYTISIDPPTFLAFL